MANALNNPIFQNADKAREWLEAHLWADGPICPACGTVDNATPIKTRSGWYQCNESGCRKQFTVTVGTLFERSHVPLNKWLLAAFLICASKKGVSAHQVHRMIGVSYKSTWFMMHRLREAMRDSKFPGPLGGEGKVVEADETFVGGKEKNRHRSKRFKKHAGGNWGKETVFSLVERGGQVRSVHTPSVTAATAHHTEGFSLGMDTQCRWGCHDRAWRLQTSYIQPIDQAPPSAPVGRTSKGRSQWQAR